MDDPPVFSEIAAWKAAGTGWQPLYGSFHGIGFSFEWHDFTPKAEFDWGATFHPGSLELCLNLAGQGVVESNGVPVGFHPNTAGFYRAIGDGLKAVRLAGQRHQFLTVEYSSAFLARHLAADARALHPMARGVMEQGPRDLSPAMVTRLTAPSLRIVESLRHPPVFKAAQPVWYQCKAVELAVMFLFQQASGEELFCTRQQRIAQDRVEQVIFLLKQHLAEPLALDELGRRIGCSPFYLSRIFSAETGQTITQYLRTLRLEMAAELLRSGEYNVTEAAMEVGYSSLSHFSQAFHEMFGCCPGLYPVSTPSQAASRRLR